MSLSLGAAAIIGGTALAGTAGGGILSHHEAKASRDQAQKQFEALREDDHNATQIRVADALKAGINPLAALGVSKNVSPTVHVGGGSDVGQMVAAGGREASRVLQQYLTDQMETESESAKLDLESKRLENRILDQRLKSMTNSPETDEKPNMMGQEMLFKPVYDLQGRPRLVINQNAMEGDADNPGYVSSILATIGNGIKDGFIDPVSGEIKSDQMRIMLDDFYYKMYGHHIMNLESLYISPAEAAAAAAYVARGVS